MRTSYKNIELSFYLNKPSICIEKQQ